MKTRIRWIESSLFLVEKVPHCGLNGIELDELAGAVSDRVGMDARSIQQSHIQVGYGCLAGIGDVAPRLYGPAASSRDQDREVFVGMAVAVADTAAVDNQGVIEERSVAVRGRSELAQEAPEQIDVE